MSFFRQGAQGAPAAVGGGGGGGGGSQPSLLSDITAATPASDMIAYGKIGHGFATVYADYDTWAGWGFAGHTGAADFRDGYTPLFKGTTAFGDSTPGPYEWQRSYEGYLSLFGNHNNTKSNGTLFPSFQNGHTRYAGLFSSEARVGSAGGSSVDVWDSSSVSAAVTRTQGLAGFLKLMGATHTMWDLETGVWDWAVDGAGHTQTAWDTQYEAYGYAYGTALYSVYPSCHIFHYDWGPNGSWITSVVGPKNSNPNAPPANTYPYMATETHPGGRDYFLAGVFRAHKDQNATGGYWWMDSNLGYRGPQYSGVTIDTACKWNTLGTMSYISRYLPQSTWDHIAPYVHISFFSWPGVDGGAGTFYYDTQPFEPTYTDWLKAYRKYGMGGIRFDFTFDGAFGTPGDPGSGHSPMSTNNYSAVSGRIAGMQAAADPTSHDSTAITVGTVGQSRVSGSSTTLTFTAKHPYGMHHVTWKLYASNGTTVLGSGEANMALDISGGSPTGGIPNAFMSCTANITANATAGLYVTLDVYSAVSQRTSRLVQLT